MGASVGCTDDRKDEWGYDDDDDEDYDIRRDEPQGKGGPKTVTAKAPENQEEESALRIQAHWRGKQVRMDSAKEHGGDAAASGRGDAKAASASEQDPLSARSQSFYKEPLLHMMREEDDNHDLDDDDIEGPSYFNHWSNLLLASRTAFACILCATPVLIPSVYAEMDAAYSSMIGGGVILMVVFTIYANLGLTIQLAWQGFISTACACVPVHVLAAMMPHGAASEHCRPGAELPEQCKYDPFIVHATNVACIWFGLWLNISKNAKMFFVCYHLYFIMEFMNPNTKSAFNTTWRPDWDAYTTATLVTASVGMLIAVFVMLFPLPIRATNACRNQAIDSVNVLTDLVDGLVDYYCGSTASVRIVRLQMAAVKLRDSISGMQANLDGSWWETFNVGRAGRSRALLQRHLEMLRHMADNMFSLQVCIAKEDFGETHKQMMGSISMQVRSLVEQTMNLLRLCTLAANDGSIDGKERKRIKHAIGEVESRMQRLAVAYDKQRKEIMPNKRICPELQSESFFCYCLSVYGRQAVEYAKDLLERPPQFCSSEMPFFLKDWITEWLAIFDTKILIKSKDNWSFAIRNSLSIVISFYIGFWYLGFDAVPAGTVSVLISNFSGSALQKNMGRLQAVTLATILPHLIVEVMGQYCDFMRGVMQAGALAAWEVVFCYVYYQSPTYGYVGCLLAAQGAGLFVFPCTNVDSTAEVELAFGTAAFTKIVDLTLGVIVMTFVDLALSGSTAAQLATESYLRGLLACDAFFQGCLAPRQADGAILQTDIAERKTIKVQNRSWTADVLRPENRTPGVVLSFLGLAEVLNEEANKEPRYHRTPWPKEFVDELIHSAYVMRGNLKAFEELMDDLDHKHWDIFADCRGMQAFISLKKDICDTMQELLSICEKILKNDTGKPLPAITKRLDKLEMIDKLEDMQNFMDQINASDKPSLAFPEKVATNLEADLLVRLNVACMIMDSTIETVAAMIKGCIKHMSN